MHNEDARAERELVRRQAGQVEQEEKAKRARFRKAQRVKDKTHQDPLPAHKQVWKGGGGVGEGRTPRAVSPFKKRSRATDPRDWEML